jgi:hypothetical protein
MIARILDLVGTAAIFLAAPFAAYYLAAFLAAILAP